MSLTIAIPSYNKEKYIERCIKSVLIEKNLVDKIIVVDNCSTDKTIEISRKFEPEITCIVNETNLGMSGNFNKCIELCETEWLMILHADDELLPGAISKYLEYIKKYPDLGLIHADSYSIVDGDESTKNLNQIHKKELWKAGLDALSCPYGVCSAVMVKKSAYDKLGGFINWSLSSDAEMWARIAGKYDVGYINHPTVIYHISAASLGPQSLIKRSVKQIKDDWDNLNQRISESYPTPESSKAYLDRMHQAGPANYWPVFKANLIAGNYKNAIHALYIIVFTYNGLIPLCKIIGRYALKHLKIKG